MQRAGVRPDVSERVLDMSSRASKGRTTDTTTYGRNGRRWSRSPGSWRGSRLAKARRLWRCGHSSYGNADLQVSFRREEMSNWTEEAIQAPRDAWGLLIGLASAGSIFALLRHEFTKEPLRVAIDNWQYWSHGFWAAIGQIVHLAVKPDVAAFYTATALTWIVVLRGVARGQTVHNLFGGRRWPWFAAYGVSMIVMFVMIGIVVVPLASSAAVVDDTSLKINSFILLFCTIVWPLGISYSLLRTPRSFFGVVIAAIALLLIDRIPLLAAATTN